MPAPVRLPVPTAKPSPPSSNEFPPFCKGPLHIIERKARDVTYILRRVLRVFHPKKFGSLGTGINVWWDMRVPSNRLTSSISKGAVGDREEFCPGDFLPWQEMNLGTRFHSGPG